MTKLKLLLSSPFLLLLLFIFNPVKVLGQALPVPPDCVVFVNVTTTSGSAATIPIPASPWFDNRTVACQTWTIQYQAAATSGTFTSISVQSANGTVTPLTGAFSDWSGTVSTGINPNTNQTGAVSTLTTGCVSMTACTTPNSYIRVLLTRNNFVGTINGVLYGYRSGYPGGGGGGSGSGCPGTIGTPCVVVGPTAAGSAPTTSPVLVAGQDGAPGVIRTLKTDAVGEPIPANASFAGADGISNTQNSPAGAGGAQLYDRILPYIFGGTTNDRQFACLFQAVAVLAPGTTGVLVTGVALKDIKICHYHMSSTSSVSMVLNSGTGVNCNMGTVQIDGFDSVTSFAMDFSPLSPLKANAVGDDICYTFTPGNVTATFTVIYAQY